MLELLPPEKEMYDALVRRDAAFEGLFFVGVTTTGIFCRPTCPARKPKPENVQYFGTTATAIDAGFRPCLRCRPMEVEGGHWVQKLIDAVEAEPDLSWSAADLQEHGIDPDKARRQFKRKFGITFAAYVRAQKMGSALDTIRNGNRVIDAQLDSGFESASGFREAFHRQFGTPPRAAAAATTLHSTWMDSPLGGIVAITDDAGLHLLEFVDRRALKKEVERLQKRTGAAIVPGETVLGRTIREELEAYFSGRCLHFTTPLIRHGTPFQESVWDALLTIPPGETRSYLDIATALGKPTATRAVAQANGANQLAIIIPCHRVIGADGSLTGYGGGRWRKQWLIDHERRFK